MRAVAKLFISCCLPLLLCAAFSMTAVGAVFVVNSTVDDNDANTTDGICQTSTIGQCTLRAAIQQANASAGSDTINFLILPGGQQTITVLVGTLGQMPFITEVVTIDATTQDPTSSVPPIVLTSDSAGQGRGLTFQYATAGTSVVKGFVINNFQTGIRLLNSGLASVQVKGNYLGTNASGTAALGNSFAGVLISESSNNLIGGTTASDRNVISGNGGAGVDIEGSTSTNNTVRGNYLGTDASGTSAIGNFYGIIINEGSGSLIGGVGAGEGNRVAFNFIEAVVIASTTATGNAIRGNSIYSNAGIGIDQAEAGATLNDAGDPDTGPNNLQNYPLLTYNVGFNAITATLNSSPATTFNIDFYSNPANERQGRTYLGTRQLTTDGSGNGSVSATFSQQIPAGQYITATATRAAAPLDTSEFAIQLLLATPTAANATIIGTLLTTHGAPLVGAVVNLTGSQTRKTVTDANGNYRFDGVETSGFYTIKPSLAGFSFGPESRSFTQLGNQTEASFTATPNSTFAGNAIDSIEYFVRQHYLDFLGREPDESGFNFWSDQILECVRNIGCEERKRIHVSAAYFLSVEFQQTGGFIDGLHRASFGTRPLFAGFMRDARDVGRDVVVGKSGWEAKLDANKDSFLQTFVERPEFISAFSGLTDNAFVSTLISHTGVNFSQGERDAMVSNLAAGTLTRAAVLRQIAEDKRFTAARFNDAFVMMQYFGYLRRDPDEDGFNFWLTKLNQFDGDFEKAEMVKAFIDSGEYRARFPN